MELKFINGASWTFLSLALLNDEAWGAGGADTDQIIAGGRVTSPDSQSEVTQDNFLEISLVGVDLS